MFTAGGHNYYEEEREHLCGKPFDWNAVLANMTSFQLSGYRLQDAFPERTVQFALMLCA